MRSAWSTLSAKLGRRPDLCRGDARVALLASERKPGQVVDSRAERGVALQHHPGAASLALRRVDLGAQVVEDREAQSAIMRPLRVADADHQLGPEPADRR